MKNKSKLLLIFSFEGIIEIMLANGLPTIFVCMCVCEEIKALSNWFAQ